MLTPPPHVSTRSTPWLTFLVEHGRGVVRTADCLPLTLAVWISLLYSQPVSMTPQHLRHCSKWAILCCLVQACVQAT